MRYYEVSFVTVWGCRQHGVAAVQQMRSGEDHRGDTFEAMVEGGSCATEVP